MIWFPDSNWLKVLEIRGSTAAAVAVACILILVMAEFGWFFLDTLPAWLKASVAAVAIIALVLAGKNIVQWFTDEFSKKKEYRRKEKTQARNQQKILGYLDTLNAREHKILSYLVQKKQQSFTADISEAPIATLRQKKLVEMGEGANEILNWPFMIPNFVWEELQKRRDEFNTAYLNGPLPWQDQSYPRI